MGAEINSDLVLRKSIGNYNNQGEDVIINYFGYHMFLGVNFGYIASVFGKKLVKNMLYNKYDTEESIPENEKPVIEIVDNTYNIKFTVPIVNPYWTWVGIEA